MIRKFSLIIVLLLAPALAAAQIDPQLYSQLIRSYPGVSMSAAGVSPPIIITSPGALQSLGLIVTVSSGASLTYSVQVSADNAGSLNNWNNHDVLVGLSASANGNIAYPVTAVRLNVTSWSSGTVNLGVAQWP
jgi:hypothetical protein